MKLGKWALYSAGIGCVVGFFTWLFFGLVNMGIEFLWSEIPWSASPLWPLVMGLSGGLLVGLCQIYFGEYPKLMPQVMEEYQSTKKIDYSNIHKATISALIVLWFGASLGPEAALIGIVGGLCTWAGEKTRQFYRGDSEIQEYLQWMTEGGMEATASMTFNAPLLGLAGLLKDRSISEVIRFIKIGIYTLTTVSGFGIFMLMSQIDQRESAFIKFGHANIGLTEILAVIPLMIVGLLMVKLYKKIAVMSHQLFRPLENRKMFRAIIGGLCIGVMGILIPYTLFSGEHEMATLMVEWESFTAIALITIAILKLVMTEVCLASGWNGGHIFPVLFASIATGYAMALILPIDPVLSVAVVVTTMLTGIMDGPIGAFLLMIFFFPVQVIIPMCLVAFLTNRLLERKQPVDGQDVGITV